MDWVDGGGNSTTVAAVFYVEVLYENEDVAVVSHGTNLEKPTLAKCCVAGERETANSLIGG